MCVLTKDGTTEIGVQGELGIYGMLGCVGR